VIKLDLYSLLASNIRRMKKLPRKAVCLEDFAKNKYTLIFVVPSIMLYSSEISPT